MKKKARVKKKNDKKSRKKNDAPKKKSKVEKVLHEYKTGTLHSGSKKGPMVTSRKQAVAIALSEAGMSRKRKKKRK